MAPIRCRLGNPRPDEFALGAILGGIAGFFIVTLCTVAVQLQRIADVLETGATTGQPPTQEPGNPPLGV